jgi:hypothetical protein
VSAKPTNQSEDPNRATLLQILRELNKSTEAASNSEDDGLELTELTDRLADFWAVTQRAVKVPVILGVLLQNDMVSYQGQKAYSWVRQRETKDRYRITIKGKSFLRENIVTNDRIS